MKHIKKFNESEEKEQPQIYGDFNIVSDYILDPVFFGGFVFDMKSRIDVVAKYSADPFYLSSNEINTLIKYVNDSQLITR